MRFYNIAAAPAGERWQRTQDDGKKKAREVGGSVHLVEVPTDSHGLLEFINRMERDLTAATLREEQPVADQPPPSPMPEVRAERMAQSATLQSFEDWITDKAEAWQIERVFEALGTRFSEAMRKARTA